MLMNFLERISSSHSKINWLLYLTLYRFTQRYASSRYKIFSCTWETIGHNKRFMCKHLCSDKSWCTETDKCRYNWKSLNLSHKIILKRNEDICFIIQIWTIIFSKDIANMRKHLFTESFQVLRQGKKLISKTHFVSLKVTADLDNHQEQMQH